MKKVFAFVLAFALVMSLGVVAFANSSPVSPSSSGSDTAAADIGFTTPIAPTPAEKEGGMALYNADEKVYATVPAEDVTEVAVGDADKLSAEDKEAFLAAYEDVKAIEGKVVKYFYWVDIPESYKTDEFAWAKYEFKCTGENVEVTVNGNPMEVVHVDGVDYYAKLTEFGAVAILCD